MYGIITCGDCRNNRMIDLSSSSTACPYCGKKIDTKIAVIKFSDADQERVRAVFDSMSGFVSEKKERVNDADPLSTLAYTVDHCSDVGKRMDLISEGLTRILGTFTVGDVDGLVPGSGDKYVKSMLENCLIYETEPNRFKA